MSKIYVILVCHRAEQDMGIVEYTKNEQVALEACREYNQSNPHYEYWYDEIFEINEN